MLWYLLALGAALFYALRDIAKKRLLQKESTIELLVHVYLIIFVIAALAASDFSLSAKAIMPLFLRSLFFAVGTHLFTKALHHGEISSVGPLMNLSPLVLLILASFVAPEPVTVWTLAGILLTAVGAYVLLIGKHIPSIGSFRSRYVAYVALSLLAFSASAILTKETLALLPLRTFYFYTTAIVLCYFSAVYLFGHRSIQRWTLDYERDLGSILIIAVLTYATLYLYYQALAVPTALVILVIPLMRTSTLIEVALGGKLFHDGEMRRKIAATIVMLVGATLIIVG